MWPVSKPEMMDSGSSAIHLEQEYSDVRLQPVDSSTGLQMQVTDRSHTEMSTLLQQHAVHAEKRRGWMSKSQQTG